MKVVVDEGVPRDLVQKLRDAGIDASRFPKEWRNLTNGKLLAAVISSGFDRLLTNDRNMASQSNLTGKPLGVIALPSNKASVIIHRAPDIAETIKTSQAGEHLVINMDGSRFTKKIIDGTSVEENIPSVSSFGSR